MTKKNIERHYQIIQDYKKLGSLAAVGREYGLSRERVRQIVSGVSQTIIDNNKISRRAALDVRDNKILACYKEGKTGRQVAKEFKLGHTTISNIVRTLDPLAAKGRSGFLGESK